MLKRATRFKNYAVKIALAMVLVLCGYAPVNALPILDFDQVIGGGTIAYDGNGGALIGTDIVFETVVGLGTPLNNGVVLDITDGYLDFITGTNFSEPGIAWTFDGGGYFTLTGEIASLGIARTTLLTGSFTANPIVIGGGFGFIVSAFGIDTKNQDLLDFYGITSSNFQFTNTEMSVDIVTFNDTTKAFKGNVTNADISNTSIPDPAAVFLLGSACLIGFLGLRRKFIKK